MSWCSSAVVISCSGALSQGRNSSARRSPKNHNWATIPQMMRYILFLTAITDSVTADLNASDTVSECTQTCALAPAPYFCRDRLPFSNSISYSNKYSCCPPSNSTSKRVRPRFSVTETSVPSLGSNIPVFDDRIVLVTFNLTPVSITRLLLATTCYAFSLCSSESQPRANCGLFQFRLVAHVVTDYCQTGACPSCCSG